MTSSGTTLTNGGFRMHDTTGDDGSSSKQNSSGSIRDLIIDGSLPASGLGTAAHDHRAHDRQRNHDHQPHRVQCHGVCLDGGTLTAATKINGIAVGDTSARQYYLPQGQTIKLTYAGSPTWQWQPVR